MGCNGITPIHDASGQPEKLLAVSRDVTERQEAEERFRIFFEHSSDAHLLLAGTRSSTAMWPPWRYARASLESKEAVLAVPMSSLSPERQPDGSLSMERAAEIRRNLRERGRYACEWNLRRKKGDELTVRITLTMVELLGRSVQLAVWHDLTERKETEAALRESEENCFQVSFYMNHSSGRRAGLHQGARGRGASST